MGVEAVIFDLGGVVLESPTHFIAEFEARHRLEPGVIARIVGGYTSAEDGPWHRLERGELALDAFCEAFDARLAAEGVGVSSSELMAGVAGFATVRPEMLAALRAVRRHEYRTAALSNIWDSGDSLAERLRGLSGEFDLFVESWRVGMRKPEPRIYEHTCQGLGVAPADAIFLDDIGGNLKPARTMGMRTIKVESPEQAIGELEELLGFRLRD